MAKKQPTIEVYEGAPPAEPSQKARWFWRLKAKNGEVVADGSEGYDKRSNALLAADRAKRLMAEASIS